MARYIVGLIDGEEDATFAEPTIEALVRVLGDELDELADDLQTNIATARGMAEEIELAAAAFNRTRMLAASWRRLVERSGVAEHFVRYLPELDGALEAGAVEIDALGEAAHEFSDSAVGFNPELLTERLQAVRSAAGAGWIAAP